MPRQECSGVMGDCNTKLKSLECNAKAELLASLLDVSSLLGPEL